MAKLLTIDTRKLPSTRQNARLRISELMLILALALTPWLTGCVEPPESAQSDSATAPGAAPSEYRDTLVVAMPADAQVLDPAKIRDFESAQIMYLTAETLLAFDRDSLDVVPRLAESYEIEDDGLTWRFKLRQGVKFHDGTDFNADAVKYNLDRFLAKSTDDHPYYLPDMPYRDSLVTNIIKSVEVVDPYEVVIRLEQPHTPFAANLSCFPLSIISPAAFEKYGEEIVAHPVGTGPYKLERWLRNSEIQLVQNKEYWGDAPLTPTIYFKILKDPNQLFNALFLGEADLINGVSTKFIAKIEENPDTVIFSRPAMNMGYIGFNNSLEKFSDKRVRQALNYAVNKEYICDKLHDGTSIPSRGALPPGMLGALDEPVYPFDPDKAKALLAEAGYGPDNPFKMELTAYEEPRPYNMAGLRLSLVIEQNFADVGIEVETKVVDFPKFLSDRTHGDYELGYIGWGSDNGDPDNTIYEVFGVQPNSLKYNNVEANEIMIEARRESDPAKRRELYEQANRMIIEDVPVVFVNHSRQTMAGRASVEGFDVHPQAIQRYEYVRVKN